MGEWRNYGGLDQIPEFPYHPWGGDDMLPTFSQGLLWQWFNPIMTGGECRNLYNLLKNLPRTELNVVFDDYLTPGTAIALGTNSPDLAEVRDGLFLYGFAGTGAIVEQGFFTLHILHGIKANSSPTFHVHWTHNNASPSGNVKWQIDYSMARGYGVDTFPAPTTLSSTQTADAQYTHHITNDDNMAISGDFEPDTLLICRIFRDPADVADTFEDDAFLIQVDMHYERDKTGTIERNRPFTGF